VEIINLIKNNKMDLGGEFSKDESGNETLTVKESINLIDNYYKDDININPNLQCVENKEYFDVIDNKAFFDVIDRKEIESEKLNLCDNTNNIHNNEISNNKDMYDEEDWNLVDKAQYI
jgi:hypothetical protein